MTFALTNPDNAGGANLPPVYVYPILDSTQSEAARLLKTMKAPFWVRADLQSAGRGRQGRAWLGDVGDYYASLVWPMPNDPAEAPKLSLVTAYALYQTLKDLGAPELAVKWPNDVLVYGRKLAGILLEASGAHVIIGIGVNLVNRPDVADLERRALPPAALGEFATLDPEGFHAALAPSMARALGLFGQGRFDEIRRALNAAIWVRANLVYDDGRAQELVSVREIAADGGLIVATAAGDRRIYAGDLWP